MFRFADDDRAGGKGLYADQPFRGYRHGLLLPQYTLVSIGPGHPDGPLTTHDLNIATFYAEQGVFIQSDATVAAEAMNSMALHTAS